ncbi:alpha/beta fold hydrolase [Enterobacter kobei]|uniref:alpha/beta fold hydrolase n=1 Tax=Enterobacter kobei TaxID=208224 RepID=UPI0028D405E3|nr:alpha/beta fold hydrolase [Enterobacter kobei]WNP34487.1 alpha/beta fold hydrolase [Enterobacter kobei]
MINFDNYILSAQRLTLQLPPALPLHTGNIDGLHYGIYQSASAIRHIVVVYHGGGVHSQAGYQILAHQLSAMPGIAVCLVDIRGHGRSASGKLTHPRQIWQDVDTLLSTLHATYPQACCHLLGHSSGGGMLLNYATRLPRNPLAHSLILLAPELGPFSGTMRPLPEADKFATVKNWPFILNALSAGRLCAQYPAVKLHFPAHVLKNDPHFVCHYTVNMANALTPQAPAKQLAALSLPTLILAAQHDELFSAEAITTLVRQQNNPQVQCEMLPGCGHLDCVFGVAERVRQFIA